MFILFYLNELSIYRYIDYKREVFKLGNFSQEWEYRALSFLREIVLFVNFHFADYLLVVVHIPVNESFLKIKQYKQPTED